MKILYDDQIFATQRFGGISRYICEIASRITKKHTVLVSAGFNFNHHLQEKNNLRTWGVSLDVQKAWKVRNSVNQVFTSISSNIFKPHVVHETYYRSKSLHSNNAKVVVTVHDLIHEKYPQESFHPDFFSKLKGEAIRRADAIVCVSQTTKSDLLEYFPDASTKRIEVIPHGHSYLPPSDKSRKRLTDLTKNRPFILFVGHRAGYKKFSDLVSAYCMIKAKISDHVIVAFGAGKFTDLELSFFQNEGLKPEDIVQVSGSDDLLNAAYSEATVFCYPSMYEGFGIPILEATSAGCPTVCSDTAIFREIGDGLVHFFKPGCRLSLAEALLLAMREKRLTKIIPNTYSWEQSSDSHRLLYESLVDAR